VLGHATIAYYVVVSSLRLVICYYRKDVRLPVHLQRAMATEAEAQREARAQVYASHYVQTK